MRIRIELEPDAARGWTVRADRLPDRTLRRIGTDEPSFPVADDGPLPTPIENATAMADALANLISGLDPDGGTERWGRYLFGLLFGDAANWPALTAAAPAGERIELLLAWPATDAALNRLPWEMLHGPTEFLAREPQVSIARVVAGTDAALPPDPLPAPPRVLFVVGTELTGDVIRPGAEYLGLLRRLETDDLTLRTHLVPAATTPAISAAIRWFRPNVVHFICHGVIDSVTGRGALELVDPDNAAAAIPVDADRLIDVLKTDAHLPLPPIVVLSACDTAALGLWQSGTPLAAELVEKGVPIVVGMAGPVADQACRLFANGFYNALLTDGDLAYAAAQGRRAGIRDRIDPKTAPDWAFPTLFCSDALDAPRVPLATQDAVRARHRIAREFATPGFPAFCGRIDLFEWYSRLTESSPDLQALAISVDQVDAPSEKGPRLGRTWLLHELAAQAVRDGHVPILVNDKTVRTPIKTITTRDALIRAVINAAKETSSQFGVDQFPWKWSRALGQLAPGDPLPGTPPTDLALNYEDAQSNPADPVVVATAFRLDVLDILATIPAVPGEPMRLLFLIDDIHRMGPAAKDLCADLLGPFGLRHVSVRGVVRTVVSYSTQPAVGQEVAVDAIKKWIGESRWVQVVPLERYVAPDEERLAYEQFLLHWRAAAGGKTQRLIASRQRTNEQFVCNFFNTMAKKVQGFPSFLPDAGQPFVEMCLDLQYPALEVADDNAALEVIEKLRR